jgi:hypothetical protein
MAAARWTRTSFGVLFTLYAAGLLIWLTLGLLIHRLPQSAIAATIPLALTDTGASSVGTAGERWRSE